MRSRIETHADKLLEYFAVAGASLATFAALGHALGSSWMLWSFGGATMVGVAISFLLRHHRATKAAYTRYAPWVDIVLSAVVIIGQGILASAGAEAQAGDDFHPAIALAYLMAVRSVVLASNGALLFQLLPPIAIFGLATTWVSSTYILICFFIYYSCAVCLMVSEHRRAIQPTRSVARNRVRNTFLWTTVFGLGAALLSLGLTPIAQGTIQFVGGSLGIPMVPRSVMPVRSQPTDVQVGTGPVNSTAQEIMRVKSPVPFYLRGRVFEEYTGRGWKTESAAAIDRPKLEPLIRNPDGTADWSLPKTAGSGEAHSGTPMQLRVQLVAPNDTIIYAPQNTLRVRGPFKGVLRDQSNNMLAENTSVSGFTYTLEAVPPVMNPGLLKSIDQSWTPNRRLLQVWADPNLQNAETLNTAGKRLSEIAKRLTAGKQSQLAKVEALRDYIADTCLYNTQANAFPRERDAVEYFLTVQKEGYCDAFATSLAVLSRHAGIPARVAAGFLPGDYDAEADEYIVRDSHRHMWTEIYFEGYGWIPFDATQDAREAAAGPLGASAGSRLGRLLPIQAITSSWVTLFLTMSVVAVVLLAAIRLRRQIYTRLGGRVRGHLTNRLFHRFCESLKQNGCPPRELTQGPTEYFGLCANHLSPQSAAEGARLADAFDRWFYGPQTPSPADVTALAATVDQYAKRLKKAR